ncbi:M1 family aminopeptidase [uncultured Formosa sp.]|uniref:M1 family metallopeptidase n=1 Tax=uncultured Formosa sp. TaxID=255435 RepID=UPI0026324837|nr:M1 family aminopeptidase [uncultured Formosa sp.]
MKFNIVAVLILCSLWSCKKETKDYSEIQPGVSWELAQHRKANLSDINYKLSFNLPEEKLKPILANLELRVTLKDVNAPLVLDFNPNNTYNPKVFIASDSIESIQEHEHLIIPQNYLKTGENVFQIEFQAGDQYLYRNDEYLYTLSVPDHARALFPCFDQPNLKASFNLELTAPKDWNVLSATYPQITSETANNSTYVFETSNVMSTYLFSFVAGKFNEVTRHNHRFLYREEDSLKIKESLDPIFKLHKKSLTFLEDYTAYQFPFKKLDFASIPFFQFGGMEHVGAIQYKESSLFFEDYMPKLSHWNRANLISHEVSHMWFGNLVTMNWFDDVWLKEVFANFMAAKVVNPNFPELNFDLLTLVTKAPRAYNVDRTKGTNAIRQNLDNLNNAGSLYGAIIYNKAPIMMNQLEMLLGKEQFRIGIQEYIKTYANNNATWEDLIAIFDAKSDTDLKTWSNVWVNQSGRPVFTNDIVYENNTIKSLTLHQKAENGSANLWPQKLEMELIYLDSIAKRTVFVEGKSQEIKSLQGMPKPKAIVYNSDGYGYGVFPIDSVTALNSYRLKDEVARASNYINTYENALLGNIPIKTALNTFLNGLQYESNELIMGTLSSDFTSLYWDFLSDAEREQLQPTLSKKLWKRLNMKLSTSVKKNVYKAFSNIAYGGESLNQLYKIWNKDVVIDSLKLNEKDITRLAMTLVLYNHPKHEDILEKAETQISSADAMDRFKFLLPALSSNNADRETLFLSFKDVKNRKKSNWVETANHYIHHPLHQKEAIKYVSLSLDVLEEVKNTSDLFFPLKWLESTIGKYQSKEAQTILNMYLSTHPELNPQLKFKILQATDNLSRYQDMISN